MTWSSSARAAQAMGRLMACSRRSVCSFLLSLRGRIRIDGERTGVTIERFNGVTLRALAAGWFVHPPASPVSYALRSHRAHSVIGRAYAPTRWPRMGSQQRFLGLMIAILMVSCVGAHNIPNRADLKWWPSGGISRRAFTHRPGSSMLVRFSSSGAIVLGGRSPPRAALLSPSSSTCSPRPSRRSTRPDPALMGFSASGSPDPACRDATRASLHAIVTS